MSVLIKGMNMPKDGNSIDISIQDSGAVLVKSSEGYYEYKGNIAVEIPTPHGRLIDADIVSEKIGIAEKCEDCKFWNGQCERGTDYYVCDIIYDSPTILEAED